MLLKIFYRKAGVKCWITPIITNMDSIEKKILKCRLVTIIFRETFPYCYSNNLFNYKIEVENSTLPIK